VSTDHTPAADVPRNETAPGDEPLAPTGHPAVDAALDRLADVRHLGAREQVERYGEVHRSLHETLRGIDTN
jgi:hypothetical protein